LKKVVLTSGITIVLVVVMLLTAAGYFLGGYFIDLALRRGNAEDPKAPPAVFTMAFTTSGGLHPAARPRSAAEDWQLQSFDGLRLAATHFSPRQPGHAWVVLVHGYGCNQQYTWDFAGEYLRHGYEVLTPDMRASGESEGTYLTMGALEARDIAKWTQRIAEVDPEARIVLHGVSMGAAAAMLAAAEPLPPQVTAIVEDSGYTDVFGMFSLELQKLFGLPSFPVLDCANLMGKVRTGVYLRDVRPVEAVRQSKVPMLFIHGDADQLVPYAMMQELYAASAAPQKEELTVKGAAHAVSASAAHDAYYKKVFAFADRYTNSTGGMQR